MYWTDFFIKRPVFSISLSCFLLFMGIFGYFHLSLRLFPKIDTSMITVAIDYAGADADTMQSSITNTVENSLAGIPEVNYITSSSMQGHATINIYLNVNANANSALTDVAQKIASVRGQLPEGIDEPIISKADADDNPVLLLAFTSDVLSRSQISDYLTREVKPLLESIDGVASADVLGGQYAMRLWLNPNELAAYHLSAQNIIDELKQQNVQSTAGSLEGATQQNIIINSELNDVAEFNNLIVKRVNNTIIRLKDVGEARLGEETNKINAFYNGKPAVMLFIKPAGGANPLSIVNDVEKILPSIAEHLPQGLHVDIAVNAATYIKKSIFEVLKTMLEAMVIVGVVIFLFLGCLRSTLIPLVTIPLSLIGILFFLMLLGYSINLLTLLAMVIAIGLVVDDAVVVMENIHRYIENGETVFKSAILATREITFSIISMTLTLAAIFLPIAFSTGITGRLFSEFALTLAGTVIISGVVALTLSPMMCATVMRKQPKNIWVINFINQQYERLSQFYIISLEKIFSFKKSILIFWLFSLIVCFYFYQTTNKELSPKEDEGFLQVIATAPNSTNTHFLMDNSEKLPNLYNGLSDIASSIYINGIPEEHQILSFVRLIPWDTRKISSMQLQPILQEKLNQISGLQSVVIVPSVLPGTSGFPVSFVLKSQADYQQLYNATEKLLQFSRKSGLFLFLTSDLNYDQPVLKVEINKNAAAAIGVNINSITQTLSIALSENKVQYFNLFGRSYQVIPQIYANDRLNPQQLDKIYVTAQNNAIVPLSALVSMHTVTQPSSLNQFQKFNSVTFSGVMAAGHTLSEGLNFLNNTVKTALPQSVSVDYAGNSRQFIEEGNHMLWLFLSALIVIFLLLAMQFESFRDPLIILLGSLPMALMAAMLPLKFGYSTINIYTQVGLLTLAGLISKHGILLTQFANNEQIHGFDKYHAIMRAASVRFRPILMTTFTIVFGVLPLVFAEGCGDASRFNIGIVIFFGMLFGTFFTLFVVPIIYYYLSSQHLKKNYVIH